MTMGIPAYQFLEMVARLDRNRLREPEVVKDEITDLHGPIMAWAAHQVPPVPLVHCRPDKKSRQTPGSPDFVFPYRGQWFAIECKAPDGELRPAQSAWIRMAEDQKCEVRVIRSMADFFAVLESRQL